MAVLNDANLSLYAKYVVDLRNQVKTLQTHLTSAENALNDSTGATFRTEYAKGKKASSNISAIIDILQTLKSDLNVLITDAYAFYTTSVNASKKK